MATRENDAASYLTVERGWLSRVMVLLNEAAEDSAAADLLLRQASGAIGSEQVAIRRPEPGRPGAFGLLRDG